MIRKVLVANRGEIAMRVMRSCKEMGIATVAVYSNADRASLHVSYADEAVCIGDPASADSYLNQSKIIGAAKETNADAIHPGYGFLSENAEFADMCSKNGITFIGPDSHSIRVMGDKISAREAMIAAGVLVVPGMTVSDGGEGLIEGCRAIGFPVILKATAGGGGKGMRLVEDEASLLDAFEEARSEARSSFGNDEVYVEKYIESPHHIEIQLLADKHGKVIHLLDRECSVQRRHQKIVEECPSPFISEEVRAAMGDIAVKVAKAVGYVGAGTVEFLVDAGMNFYFLEMNTRLQVEHPVTEEVMGVDLVKEQIKIASGLPMSYRQEEIKSRGHAIECRICAEDPDNNFIPTCGIIHSVRNPQGIGVRIDSFIYDGYEVPIYYDSMLSKLVVWATTRQYALERMRRVLYEYKITGIKTNIDYLRRIMDVREFVRGRYTTHFIQDNTEALMPAENARDTEDVALIAAYIDYIVNKNSPAIPDVDNRPISRWRMFAKQKGVLRI